MPCSQEWGDPEEWRIILPVISSVVERSTTLAYYRRDVGSNPPGTSYRIVNCLNTTFDHLGKVEIRLHLEITQIYFGYLLDLY